MYIAEKIKTVRRGSRTGDPADMANGAGADEWVRQKLGFQPDAAQTRVLTARSRRVVMNCTRQWGKSTVTAAKAVHQAYTVAESLTLVVSPSARQTAEFLRKAGEFVRRLKVAVKGDGDNELSLLLPNRSRIVGVPGNESTVRGFSAVSLLLVDEAARVSCTMRSRQLAGGERRHLVVDGTGVGPAVVDLLRREDLRSRLWAVTITCGESERYADGYYRVPKQDLIVGLQVLMERGGLRIAAGMREGATLVKEMAAMRVKISGSAHERYGAWQSGEHDDLVLAVALACWGVRKAGLGRDKMLE